MLDTRSAAHSVKSYRRLHTLEFDSVSVPLSQSDRSIIVTDQSEPSIILTDQSQPSITLTDQSQVRRRMSVIVRHPGGKIYLITKVSHNHDIVTT